MIRIRMEGSTLDRTRLAASPLHELVRGLELAFRPGGAPWPYAKWVDRARGILRDVPATAPLRVYGRLARAQEGGPTPDAFVPVPSTPAPELGEQLRVLRDTPADVIRAQLAKHYPGGTPDHLLAYDRDPARAFGALADAMAVFWEAAVAPHWPVMRTVLEEEVLLRARTLAGPGPQAVLADLGGTTRWESPVLSLPKRKESALLTAGQRLLLVPLIFADQQVTCSTDDPDVLMISYQARGAAVLDAGRTGPAGEDRLRELLGPGRAAVLRALREPATTTTLAAVLGRSPSTVSEHLAALLRAGAVARLRLDRQVFYRLERPGRALLETFDSGIAESLGTAGGSA